MARLKSSGPSNPYSISEKRQSTHPDTPFSLAVTCSEVPTICLRSSVTHTPDLGEYHALVSKNSRA